MPDFSIQSDPNVDVDFVPVFLEHYFGEISDKQLDTFLKEHGTDGLGNNVRFDAAGKLVEIEGVTVETGSFSQSGNTATITHDGSETINVGNVLNIIFLVGSTNQSREVLSVASVTSSTVFTVTRTTSATIPNEVVSFYIADLSVNATYEQQDNLITITHASSETINVDDVINLDITSGSATSENLPVTSVTSSTVFVVESSTSITSTSGNLKFTKQNQQNLVEGSVDGINATNNSPLSSKQSNSLIDVLSEGEIAGFYTAIELNQTQGTDIYNIAALKDVFLDGTQVLKQSADISNLSESDFNFLRGDVSFEPRFGTSSQTSLDTINEIETEIAVGVEVKKATPVSRSISDQIDKLRITMLFPSLQFFEVAENKMSGTQVNIEIKITENNGSIHTPILGSLGSVKGKSLTPYSRDYIITGLKNFSYPITVTVTRISNDSDDSNLSNQSTWSSFTKITSQQRAYADIAHVGLRFNAESFRSIPVRTYRIKGIKVKIPHNATVRADGSLSFSGTFNGTLKTDKEWTSDPAWVLYDVLTNTRYGASISETTIDKFSFYSASVYNSELVDDGSDTGSTEPRFSCNVNINNQIDAFTLIQNICSVMHAQAFYEAGSITITQDRPSDPVYTFNISNVLEGGFSYSNQSQKAKFTKINVGFFDMLTQSIDYETEDDLTAQSKYGIKTQTIKAFGITSRGQASRHAKWLLFNQNNSSELVNFVITAEAGVVVRPGQIISIADKMKQGVRRGGRINAATTNTITVDNTSDTNLDSSNSPTVSVIMPDGTLSTKTVGSISGAVITLSSGEHFQMEDSSGSLVNTAPNVNSVWVLQNTTVEATTWRVINVQENENLTFSITAASHNSGKYASIEDGTPLPVKNFTLITRKLPAPENLSATEEIVVINNKAISRLNIQFSAVKGAIGYYLQHNFNNSNFINQELKSTEFSIDNISSGKFTIRVFSVNTLNKLSDIPNQITFNSIGKTELPEDPTNLTFEPVSEQFIRLRFNQSISIDVIHGGGVQVRHTPNTGTLATFANSTDIVEQLAGNATEALVPALPGTYSIKFIDDGGRRSANAAQIGFVSTQPDAQPNQIILTQREDTTGPPFQGEKSRTRFDADLDGLVLDGSFSIDMWPFVDGFISNFDFGVGDIFGVGSYDFVNIVDLGSIFNLNLIRRFVTSAVIINDLFDSRLAFIDFIIDFDGAVAETCNAKLLVSTSQGDPAISTAATYSQTQNLITLNATSHGASVGDNFRVDFTSGTAEDSFLKVASVTNDNVCVLEAKTKFEKYTLRSSGFIRFNTGSDYDGLVAGDTIKAIFLTGPAKNFDNNFTVLFTLPGGGVQLSERLQNLSNTPFTSGGGVIEFIKIKDSSGNNVTTSGNCNISNVFSPYNVFANGEFRARAFKFRVEMTSEDPDETINVSELGFEASVKRRTETVNTAIASNCATSGGAKTVTFQDPFFTGTASLGGSTSAFLPTIGITLEGVATGDFFNITSVTGTQFTIETRSSSGLKDMNFKYTAIGFGKGS